MIIGIVGKARSGKDTVAGFLGKYGFERIAFADSLKDAVAVKFGIDRCLLDGRTATGEPFDREQIHPIWGRSYRQILQLEGTEATRDVYDRDFWLKRMEIRLAGKTMSEHSRFVIPDVRFENEVQFVKDRGGIVVGVMRADCETVAAHSSEALADQLVEVCDYVLSNGKDLAYLEKQVEGLAIEFLRTGKAN